jgi:hypothetical protein
MYKVTNDDKEHYVDTASKLILNVLSAVLKEIPSILHCRKKELHPFEDYIA